jgi:hypothetical protein
VNKEALFLNVERMIKECTKRPHFLIADNVNAYISEFNSEARTGNEHDPINELVSKKYTENQEIIDAYELYKKNNILYLSQPANDLPEIGEDDAEWELIKESVAQLFGDDYTDFVDPDLLDPSEINGEMTIGNICHDLVAPDLEVGGKINVFVGEVDDVLSSSVSAFECFGAFVRGEDLQEHIEAEDELEYETEDSQLGGNGVLLFNENTKVGLGDEDKRFEILQVQPLTEKSAESLEKSDNKRGRPKGSGGINFLSNHKKDKKSKKSKK